MWDYPRHRLRNAYDCRSGISNKAWIGPKAFFFEAHSKVDSRIVVSRGETMTTEGLITIEVNYHRHNTERAATPESQFCVVDEKTIKHNICDFEVLSYKGR